MGYKGLIRARSNERRTRKWSFNPFDASRVSEVTVENLKISPSETECNPNPEYLTQFLGTNAKFFLWMVGFWFYGTNDCGVASPIYL
jgi:hypothetical protein